MDTSYLADMRRSPMFINWKPVTADFGPWRQNQQQMLAMTADMAQRAQATRQKAQELGLPEFKGINTDVYAAQERAMDARNKMQSVLSRPGNPFVHARSREFLEAQSAYVTATSPAVHALLAEQQAAVEGYGKQVGERTKKGEGASSFLFLDSNGNPIPDPEDPSQLLTAGDAHYRRMNDLRYNVESGGQQMDFNGAILASPDDYQGKLLDRFSKTGASKWSIGTSQDIQQLQAMQSNAEASPAERLLSAITVNGLGEGNASQINSAVQAELSSMTAGDRASVLNAFYASPEFAARARKKYSKDDPSGFLAADGSIDTQRVMNAVFSDADYGSPLRTMKGKVTYAERFVLDNAAQFLSSTEVYNPKMLTIRGFQTGGGGGETEGLVNYHAYKGRGLPMQTDPATGQRVIAAEKFTAMMPAAYMAKNPDGSPIRVTKLLQTDAYREPMPTSVQEEHMQDLGLGTLAVPTAPEERRTLGQVLPNTEVFMAAGGKKYNSNDLADARIEAIMPQLTYLPNRFGQENADLARPGAPRTVSTGSANDYTTYLTVKVTFPDSRAEMPTDNLLTAEGVSVEYPIDDPLYRTMNKGVASPGVGPTSDYQEGSNWTRATTLGMVDDFGNVPTETYLYIPVKEGSMLERGKYLVKPEDLLFRINEEREEEVRQSAYEQAVRYGAAAAAP